MWSKRAERHVCERNHATHHPVATTTTTALVARGFCTIFLRIANGNVLCRLGLQVVEGKQVPAEEGGGQHVLVVRQKQLRVHLQRACEVVQFTAASEGEKKMRNRILETETAGNRHLDVGGSTYAPYW